ncbi:hypothetical protein [Methylobacterium nodulans]|uniref:Uncharacterized protein n=1 Tax=Methylobacterium nodulans (strain LMG 21967 / CNCM I-2342 / ORS 2060) TaxID=460265 RepID=B8IVC8_METNO|nr:hypothetical protein [Methylobacterium nodulans]ACL60979.1 hypothetical protein Mnod_6163 [Methylobacterium nodulans ORS 2060]
MPASKRNSLKPGAALECRPRYNLFRRRSAPDLCFAVLECYPVPVFIAGSDWELAGAFDESSLRRTGFDAKAADLGMNMNGFYVFQLAKALPGRRPQRRAIGARDWAGADRPHVYA